jgi:tetratricopeptide (TPR) repeat protein
MFGAAARLVAPSILLAVALAGPGYAQSLSHGAAAPTASPAAPAPQPSAKPKPKVAAKKPPAKPHPVAAHPLPAGPHVAAKLLERGANSTPAAGPGDVVVQVFVKKDGTFDVSRIIKSTNPANNDAALEIAKSSKYAVATRGGKPVDEYYDFALAFGGGTATLGTPPPSGGGGPLATALATIHAGNYDQAKTQLQAYLGAHPGDPQAEVLLGVADSFGGDPAGASAAFDKAGTVPDQYKALALQSYEKYSTSALNDQKYNDAITAAGHAIEINPQDVSAYYTRGVANTDLLNYAAGITDLQKTLALAGAAKTDQKTMLAIEFNLAVAQLNAGQYGEAATTARDIYRDDVDLTAKLDKFAFVAVTNAAIPLANAGNIPASVSRLESGATAFPHEAGALTGEAAYIMASDKKPDWDKIKAEADKALALDPTDGRANFVLGIQAAQKSDGKTALDYMNKAKGSPAYSSDPGLAKQINDALTKLNASTKLQ